MNKAALNFHDQTPPKTDLAAEVIAGLTQSPKMLSPKFFYDRHGSELFDAITRLPEYYVTRTEISILDTAKSEIAQALGSNIDLIELGCGSLQKIQLLLESVKPAQFVPIDISKEHLRHSAERLAHHFPWLHIQATCMDYSQDCQLPFEPQGERKVAFFPGSSIGNFEPSQAQHLLDQIYQLIGPNGGLLIGIDLKKNPNILERAYNDSQKVTAAFNKNILSHLNHTLHSDFDVERFKHIAFYNEPLGRIEMHLESLADRTYHVANTNIPFKTGERIHTENSYKYSTEEFTKLAQKSGFALEESWQDTNQYFSVMYFTRP